jgi:hypothetical protein
MDRWAANTLRTVGIILTSGLTLIIGLVFVLFSICAAQGGFSGYKHSNEAVAYGVGAFAVLIGGIAMIAWLARGIYRSPAEEHAYPAAGAALTAAEVGASGLLHLSPVGRKATERLVLALGAQIVVSGLGWVVNQLAFWTRPQQFAAHNWTLLLLAPFVLYHIPYAILIYALVKRPDRRAFTYSIAVPSVMILQALFSLTVVSYYYVHRPMGFVLLFVPWAIHIVILVLAYQAIQQVGLHPQPTSLILAAVVTYLFLSFIHAATPFLYRFSLYH